LALSKKRPAGAERLYRARRAAAKELKLPVDSWQVRRYALLMCAHDNATARLASGTDVSIDNLLKIDDAMAAIRSSVPQPPITVQVEIVGKGGVPIDQLPREPEPDPSPNGGGDNGGGTAPAADNAPAVASGDNVVPFRPTEEQIRSGEFLPDGSVHPNRLPRCDPGSIHSGRLPNGTPARMAGPSYAAYGGGGTSNPFGTIGRPKPDFESHHSLPQPNWDVFPR
jgi:hypothetical protein